MGINGISVCCREGLGLPSGYFRGACSVLQIFVDERSKGLVVVVSASCAASVGGTSRWTSTTMVPRTWYGGDRPSPSQHMLSPKRANKPCWHVSFCVRLSPLPGTRYLRRGMLQLYSLDPTASRRAFFGNTVVTPTLELTRPHTPKHSSDPRIILFQG